MVPAIREYIKTGKTNDQMIREAVDAGVLMGGGVRGKAFDATDGEAALQTLRSDLKKGKSAVRSLGKLAFGWVDTLNQTAEMMNRIADYKMQRAAGKSKPEAALHAREITVDFNQKGTVTPLTNTLYMFSNSALGSSMRLLSNATKRGGWQLGLTIFALGALEAAAEGWMNGDDEEGKNMGEFTRENSFYIRNGSDVYRIPLHKSPISVIKNAGNKMVRVMMGKLKPGEAGYQLGKEMTGILTQFAGIGDIGDNEMASVWPTILQPFVQAIMNRDYADRPIERTMFDEEKPKSHNGRNSTPQFYKTAAESINRLGGGNDGRKGKIAGINTDFSPEMLKFAAESFGKNALRDVQNAIELMRTMTGESEADRRNIPVVRDYYRTTGGNDNRYFDALREYKADKTEFRDRSQWEEGERGKFIKERPWIGKMKQMNNIAYIIEDLRKRENGFVQRKIRGSIRWVKPEKSLSDDQKESAKKRRIELQAKFIDLMDR